MTGVLESALPFLAALALCGMRWLPTLLLVPIFAGHALGGIARAVVMLALALPAAPSVAIALADAPLALGPWFILMAKEAALGLLLAGLIGVPFWALEATGTYLDYQRGGNPQALDPAMSVDTSVMAVLLQQALVVFLLHSGALHALFDIVATSYLLWPVPAALPPLGPHAWAPLGSLLAATMEFALTLAAPYLLALACIEACFALLSRVSPKFPAYVAALPFKSVVAMLLIALTLPRLLSATADIVDRHSLDVRQTLHDTQASLETSRDHARAHPAGPAVTPTR